jgi:5-methylcytosine-specific restriction endonuclease McrA
MPEGAERKTCTKCLEYKLHAEFNKRPGGLTPRCKECLREYRQQNKERLAAKQSEYRQKNLAAIQHREREYARRRDAGKHAENNRASYQRNKDASRDRKAKRRAVKSGAHHEPYSRAEIFSRWGNACVYCDAPAQHLDHVHPISKGGADAPHNLVPACVPCNLSKGAKTLAEWSLTCGA